MSTTNMFVRWLPYNDTPDPTPFLALLVLILSLIVLYLGYVYFKSSKIQFKRHKISKAKVQQMNQKYDHYFKDILQSPKYIMAPMVLQSDLPFRAMCRKHGCQLCYSPMVRASHIIYNYNRYGNLNKCFITCKEDRPLIIQLCGNDPKKVVRAAKIIESLGDICDGIDLNLGCPQRCAAQENFGAFLLEKPELVHQILKSLVKNINLPISAKIRLLPKLPDTIRFVDMLIDAGIVLLGVHGRTKKRNRNDCPANLKHIRIIKDYIKNTRGLSMAVVTNGNVITSGDAQKALRVTGCDAVMSANGLLQNPYLFDFDKRKNRKLDGIKMCWEYLRHVEKYGVVENKSINDHLLCFLERYMKNWKNRDVWKLLRNYKKVKTMSQLIACVELMELRLQRKKQMVHTKHEKKRKNGLVSQITHNKVINYRLYELLGRRKQREQRTLAYNKQISKFLEQGVRLDLCA